MTQGLCLGGWYGDGKGDRSLYSRLFTENTGDCTQVD